MSILFYLTCLLFCLCLPLKNRTDESYGHILFSLLSLCVLILAICSILIEKNILYISLVILSIVLLVKEVPDVYAFLKKWRIVKRGDDV